MRKTSFTVVCLWASILLADGNFQPLNVKTGLWQVTSTHTLSGLPPITPEMQARMARLTPEQRAKIEGMMKAQSGGTPTTTHYKKCITPKDLTTNPWTNGPGESCTWNIQNSTGTDMELQGSSCAAGRNEGMKTDVAVKLHVIDPENVSATMQGSSTGNGRTMNFTGSYTGKWVNSSCPAGTD